MACHSCKNSTDVISIENSANKTNIILRFLYFLIGVVVITLLTPVIALIGFYMLFKTMVLDSSTEIMPSMTFVSGLFQKISIRNNEIVEEEDFTDDEDFDPDDYELVGVEEIKRK